MARLPICCLPLAGLGTLACGHHRLPAPLGGAPPLASTELRPLEEGPPDEPLAVVLNDTPEGDGLLRRASLAVDPEDPGLTLLEARMRATLTQQQGVGLAAPQIGLSRRVILVQRQDRAGPDDSGPILFYLNPRLTWRSAEEVEGWEGCLSVPGWRGEVVRPARIRVAYDLLGGGAGEEEVEGWTARIFQHEIDHLDGLLYLDKVRGGLVDEVEWQSRSRGAEDTSNTAEE